MMKYMTSALLALGTAALTLSAAPAEPQITVPAVKAEVEALTAQYPLY